MKNSLLLSVTNVAFVIFVLVFPACSDAKFNDDIEPGSYQVQQYIDFLKGKNIAVVANHTSLVHNVHLIDTLIERGITIKKVFSPEHGFQGINEAGVSIDDEMHFQNSVPVISLYGSKKKPSSSDMAGLDLVVFDIQDVGVRFYTYLSTLHYIMEACAENNVPLILLDRPNPNGFYIDGPVLQNGFKSFIGLHPVPVVYGMTIAEYALMINGERWLKDSLQCELSIMKCINYNHSSYYTLPVNPSPNLREMSAIYLYSSMAFFEGTIVSEGRGTDFPFMVAGHPEYPYHAFSFIPAKMHDTDPSPKLEGKTCYGIDLRSVNQDSLKSHKEIDLSYLMDMYFVLDKGEGFFTDYFDLLAGTDILRNQIINGESIEDIRNSWKPGIENFKKIRAKYLLYPDFK